MAAGFPEELQCLVGYRLGAYALGYVDDLRDPLRVLTSADPSLDLDAFGRATPTELEETARRARSAADER